MATDPLAGRIRVDLLNRGDTSFRHDLQELTEAVQADRSAALESARGLQLAAQLLLQDEAARLARLSPEDPRVDAFSLGAERALAHAALLDQEATRASVRVPLVRKTEALLHGRVVDDRGQPAGPVTVTLVDAGGEEVAGVPPAQADEAGYYALIVPAEVAARWPAGSRLGVVVSHGNERTWLPDEPGSVSAGSVQLMDIELDEEALVHLKLRDQPTAPKPPPRKAKGHGRSHE